MAFKLSDRVKNQNGKEGTIVRIVPQHSGIDKYKVDFDDKNIPSAEFSSWQLTALVTPPPAPAVIKTTGLPKGEKQEPLPEKPKYRPPECECGVKFVRHGGKHSSWCPKYR